MRFPNQAFVENGPRAEDRFYWKYNDQANQPLQVFFFTHEWTDYSERAKIDWLRFATRDSILSTSMLSLGEDTCEWTVVKQYVPNSGLEAVTVRRIHIPGLTAFLATAAKMP